MPKSALGGADNGTVSEERAAELEIQATSEGTRTSQVQYPSGRPPGSAPADLPETARRLRNFVMIRRCAAARPLEVTLTAKSAPHPIARRRPTSGRRFVCDMQVPATSAPPAALEALLPGCRVQEGTACRPLAIARASASDPERSHSVSGRGLSRPTSALAARVWRRL